MSAVRLGPVMKLTTAPAAGGGAAPCPASGKTPARESEPNSGLRAKEGGWAGGGGDGGRRRAGAGHEHERAGLGDREIDTGEPEIGVRGDGPEPCSLGAVGRLAGRHLVYAEPARREGPREPVTGDRRRVPAHQVAGAALA